MRVTPASASATAIGGMEPIVLRREPAEGGSRAEFIDAVFLPGRGMNLFQARGRLPGLGEVDLLHSPSLDDARRRFNGGPDDPMGVQSFSCGGAILVPFANRIRGQLTDDGQSIDTEILGCPVRLPADWHGPQPGAEKCAIHGLMLAACMHIDERTPDRVSATLDAGDFGRHWVSRSEVRVSAALRESEIELSVTVRNVGAALLPVGIGWHPYFAIPSGQRAQARVHLPAASRALVNNYDDVFPTGQIEPVDGTAYDFRAAQGVPLGTRYFDDSFVGLQRTPEGHISIDISDPAASYRMRLTALSPDVQALQLYSRPDEPFVVVEPQFNLADPFSPIWPAGVNTGMVMVDPGGEARWGVRWQLVDMH